MAYENSRYSFTVTKKEIIYPSKLIVMNDVIKWDNVLQCEAKKAVRIEKEKLERKFHNFELSYSSRLKLIKKINWLFSCAKSRSIKSYSGKEIYNFKVNFITLTLPSKQIHTTAEITKECFQRWLNEMRERCKMNNYVWRLEYQKNGNVHYHLVTDTFIDWHLATKVWNRIINYLGYVSEYQKKMAKMSFQEYASNYQNDAFEIVKKRYIKGKSEKWKNPNSVDCKSANHQNNIASYISKYFGKKDTKGVKKNELDNESNSFALRLWFCSRSLSKLDVINQFAEVAELPLEYIISNCENVFKVVHEYCTVYYYDFNKMTAYNKKFLSIMFKNYYLENEYIPAD